MIAAMMFRALMLYTAIAGASADTARSDSFYARGVDTANTMWVFGRYGVEIFSVNGKQRIHRISSDDICRQEEENGEMVVKCNFQGAISDGGRHVWATNIHGGDFLEVFNIRTGSHVASIPTCENPIDLEYAPFREEIFVHCWRRTAEERGRFLVYHAHQVGVEHRQIELNNPEDPSGGSTIVLDGAMPNTAVVTLTDAPFLQFVDLNNKIVSNRELFDDVAGFGVTSFSAENKHIFAHPAVCCHCGKNADLECDGTEEDVDIFSGKFKGETRLGFCGTKCFGTEADDFGVVEFSAHNQTVLAHHHPELGNGADPYTTPDGQLTFLLGYDGGQKVTVLRNKGNLVPSEKAGVIELDFSDEMGFRGVSDIAFITDDRHDVVAFSSTVSNKVILVDINEYRNPTISNQVLPKKTIELQPPDFQDISAHKNSKRNIVWAPGSNYLWVDSNKLNEVHIIELDDTGDVSKAKLHETISNVVSKSLLYVNSYEEHGGAGYDAVVTTEVTPDGDQAVADQAAVKKMIDESVEDAVNSAVSDKLPAAVEAEVSEQIGDGVEAEVDDAIDTLVADTVAAAFDERDAELEQMIEKAVDDALVSEVFPRLESYKSGGSVSSDGEVDEKGQPLMFESSSYVGHTEGSSQSNDSNNTLSVAAIVLSIIAVLIGLVNFYTMSIAGHGPLMRKGESASLTTNETAPRMLDMDAIDLQ